MLELDVTLLLDRLGGIEAASFFHSVAVLFVDRCR